MDRLVFQVYLLTIAIAHGSFVQAASACLNANNVPPAEMPLPVPIGLQGSGNCVHNAPHIYTQRVANIVLNYIL